MKYNFLSKEITSTKRNLSLYLRRRCSILLDDLGMYIGLIYEKLILIHCASSL
jgi:hypothetical protein